MKVENITYEDGVYYVSLIPNWFEKLFGVKPKTEKYKKTFDYFVFGGGAIYIREDGERTTNGDYVAEAIDKFRRKF